MKRSEVAVGNVYAMKVSGKIVPVRVEQDLGKIQTWESPRGMSMFRRPKIKHRGWNGVNLRTNRKVHINTAAKLRYTWTGGAA